MKKQIHKVQKRFIPKIRKITKGKQQSNVKLSERASLQGIRTEITKSKWISPDELPKKRVTSSSHKQRIRDLVEKNSKNLPDNYILWNSSQDQYQIVAFGDRVRVNDDLYYIGRVKEFNE